MRGKEIYPHLLWRTECFALVKSGQLKLSLEMSVSDSEDYFRVKSILEDVLSSHTFYCSFRNPMPYEDRGCISVCSRPSI